MLKNFLTKIFNPRYQIGDLVELYSICETTSKKTFALVLEVLPLKRYKVEPQINLVSGQPVDYWVIPETVFEYRLGPHKASLKKGLRIQYTGDGYLYESRSGDPYILKGCIGIIQSVRSMHYDRSPRYLVKINDLIFSIPEDKLQVVSIRLK